MKIVKLNSAQFDKFATSHKYRNYFQSSMYGNVMSKFGYRSQYLGIVNEYNKLIGATLSVNSYLPVQVGSEDLIPDAFIINSASNVAIFNVAVSKDFT